ncbi:hypothetical protein BX600DRAFT_552404 [Xylariales sp. PMI_506]|nr:hypothetical protein BX600DRAFT_552404 [Xylariales sp. PMI_506]
MPGRKAAKRLQQIQQGQENKRRHIQKIEQSPEFRLLDRVANRDGVTPQDAIQQAVDWATVAAAAQSTWPHCSAGTVDYHISLAAMELVIEDPKTGEPLQIQGSTLWTEMPSLGYTELETWCEYGGEYKEPYRLDLTPEEKLRWTRLNAFIAQLSQAATFDYAKVDENYTSVHRLDKSLHGLWTFQKALEGDGESSPGVLVGTAAMSAACAWFTHAADRLWANVQHARTYPSSSGAMGVGKYCDNGWCRFERDRWDVWRQGLEDAREAAADDETRNMVEDALAQIKRAMNSG